MKLVEVKPLIDKLAADALSLQGFVGGKKAEK